MEAEKRKQAADKDKKESEMFFELFKGNLMERKFCFKFRSIVMLWKHDWCLKKKIIELAWQSTLVQKLLFAIFSKSPKKTRAKYIDE